jgi:hypothetical protein
LNEKKVMEAFEDQERYSHLLKKQLENEQIKNVDMQNKQMQMSGFSSIRDANIVEFQLDLNAELDRLHHLLSGHYIGFDNNKNEVWIEPDDDRLKIFSDYGVKQIMKILHIYINKNKILSSYDLPTIINRVKCFGIELADLIYLEYEKIFFYPTPEELFFKMKNTIKKEFITISEKELYQKCIEWSQEELQSKFRFYYMVCNGLIDSVEDTYRRALNGEERKSLREFATVTQDASRRMDNNLQPARSLFK